MIPRIVRSGEGPQATRGGSDEVEADIDDRRRRQLLVVMQYLQAHDYLEAFCALEAETGVHYEEGYLPEASILESSLDMFANYQKKSGSGSGADPVRAAEEELLQLERGVCCTARRDEAPEEGSPMNANVTAVCWVAARPTELVAVAATVDRRLRALGVGGELLCQIENLSSPILALAAAPATTAEVEAACAGHAGNGQEVLATCMGNEALLLRLKGPAPGREQGWTLEIVQRFKDHGKHVTSGRFAPLSDASTASAHFVTVSRDHQAMLYGRPDGCADFGLIGSVQLVGEVTCCCWVSPTTFALAARDDHQLRYYDVGGPDDTKRPVERLKTNLNALGDSVVSFTVLAMAVSSDCSLIAVCTDKSRIIVLPTFSSTQLRNLYGAAIDEYDVPSICFSLDRSFLYATSSLPQTSIPKDFEGEAMCGQIAVFEVRTGEIVLKLSCHGKPVRCMDRHPYTETIVTGSFDKKVKFWK